MRIGRHLQQRVARRNPQICIGSGVQQLLHGGGVVARYGQGKRRPAAIKLARVRRIELACLALALRGHPIGVHAQRAQLLCGRCGAGGERGFQRVVAAIVARIEESIRTLQPLDDGWSIGSRGVEKRGAAPGVRCLRIGAMKQQQIHHGRIRALGRDHQRGGAGLVTGVHLGPQVQQRCGGSERIRRGCIPKHIASELIVHAGARRPNPAQFGRIVLAHAVDHPGRQPCRVRGADGLARKQWSAGSQRLGGADITELGGAFQP